MSSYNNVLYNSKIIPYLHPFNINSASLFNNKVVESMSVIEIGCGNGTNLLPLAFYNPTSQLFGIDISDKEINIAKLAVNKIGMENIQFYTRDIAQKMPTEAKKYDFILVHGMFSWVNKTTQSAIMDFCKSNLTSTGLAYISYNSQPGWAVRKTVRDLLCQDELINCAELVKKAEVAKKVANQLMIELQSRNDAYALLVKDELQRVQDGEPSYVVHEYLAEYNEGFWLKEFVNQAKQFGLDYVGDAQPKIYEGSEYIKIKHALRDQGVSALDQEQTADFLCNRTFRASILCHENANKNQVSKEELIDKVYFASPLSIVSDPYDLTDGFVETLIAENNYEITLDEPITKAAIAVLSAQWPWGDKLDVLFDKSQDLLKSNDYSVKENNFTLLIKEIIELYEMGYIHLRLVEPPQSNEIPIYPKLHALARYELTQGKPLTTPYHLPLVFENPQLKLLNDLDGENSLSSLYNGNDSVFVDQTVLDLTRWGLLEHKQ